MFIFYIIFYILKPIFYENSFYGYIVCHFPTWQHVYQVENFLVSNEKIMKTEVLNNDHIEKFSEDGRCPTREQRPLEIW